MFLRSVNLRRNISYTFFSLVSGYMIDYDYGTAFSAHDAGHHATAILAKSSVKESNITSSLKEGIFGKKVEQEGAEGAQRSGGLMGSVKGAMAKDKAARNDAPMCFPGDATVWVKHAGERHMANLKVGEVILTSTGFSEVVGFLHRELFEASFLQISTSCGSLTISREHIVFVEELSVRTNLPAACLRPGEHKLLRLSADGDFVAIPITAIAEVRSRGVYAPLTSSGNLVVDGFLCSCYATPAHWGLRNTHGISDLVMAPLKTHAVDGLHDRQGYGMPVYAKQLLSMAEAVLASN